MRYKEGTAPQKFNIYLYNIEFPSVHFIIGCKMYAFQQLKVLTKYHRAFSCKTLLKADDTVLLKTQASNEHTPGVFLSQKDCSWSLEYEPLRYMQEILVLGELPQKFSLRCIHLPGHVAKSSCLSDYTR